MTLAILVFNFYPLTAVMIVMLALLNDAAILSIAYDNVHYEDQPEAWNVRLVLGIATVLGIIGVVAAFGLFYLGERVFHLDRAHIQTLMYLKLSVAGHLTIFLTRTRGPFWSIRPARILLGAVLGTQVVATLIAVYGVFMTPLGWGWAGFVWGYALAWFLVNDRVKLLAYRIFDAVKAAPRPEAKAQPEPEGKAAEPKPETKAAPQPNAQPKAKAVAEPDAEVQRKPDVKAEAKPEAKTDAKAEPKPDAKKPKPDAKAAEPLAETDATPQRKAKTEPKPQANAGAATPLNTSLGELIVAGLVKDPEDAGRVIAAGPSVAAKTPSAEAELKPEAKAEARPETGTKTPSDSKLQTAKRSNHEMSGKSARK
jgi:H+-transporting ATPase